MLTHSDSFASDIGASHFARDGYATLRTRLHVEQGCQIDAGSRRVSERLKAARRLTKEGKYDEAWKFVRFAIERMYTLLKIRAEPGFNHRSWKDQDARYMWDSGGVGKIMLAVESNAGPRLRQILTFAAGRVHDKGSRGTTDLLASIKYLNELTSKLRLGEG